MTTEVKTHAPGTFCWIDLSTTDAEAAKKFYTELFGWTVTDVPAGEGTYTMLQKDGNLVGALYQQNPQQAAMKAPSHWLSYVSVVNVDDTARKAQELGANVVMSPMDVMDVGRMAVIQDPTKAMIAFWQPGKHIGAQMVGQPGSLVWNELMTDDTGKAETFYKRLLGWNPEKQNMGGMDYTVFKNGDKGAGGMMETSGDWKSVPPHWLVYFAVDDCDGRTKKANDMGATTVVPAMDIPTVGRFSVVADPQGAMFGMLKPEMK